MFEVKKIYQNIDLKAESDTRYLIKNRHFFQDLSFVQGRWRLLENGKPVGQGALPALSTAPQNTQAVEIDALSSFSFSADSEYVLNIDFLTKEADGVVPANYRIAGEQFVLQPGARNAETDKAKALQVESNDNSITITEGEVSLTINKENATLTHYQVAGTELIKTPLNPNFWRAMTDKDNGNQLWATSAAAYKHAAADLQVTYVDVDRRDGQAEVHFGLHFPSLNSNGALRYTVGKEGVVKVTFETTLARGLPEMPRFGLKMQFPDGFDHVRWYGRGPWENYQDRKSAARLGIYDADVSDLYTPYIRPQENGSRSDTRWLMLTNKAGTGIKISGAPMFDFTAHHNTIADFDYPKVGPNRHATDINPRPLTELILDYRQRGVGGDNTWGAKPYDAYRLEPGEQQDYALTVLLEPVTADSLKSQN